MPVQFPFLQLLTRVYHERNLHRHTASSGMRNNLQCSAHLLHPIAAGKIKKKKGTSKCLRSEVGTHSEVDSAALSRTSVVSY